ncbi:class I SAM-dependent methyltransferase [Catalinimonas niigatensis]|uniref:class I SAM-dependent methyltransferase n=1 Tax=Catalinimonas niigatensis TaxID=1397264 RepID=UPI002666300F|nr:methyltransferase domain-containing protein [Catalinimonas niigatensis]WPP52649.1 methyltransferase domain-containing protein [Catalinimonas niigatensis]
MKKFELTIEAIKNIKQIGSIASSSRFLTRKIIKEIDFSKKIRVLELGAGNGVFTREILKRMSSDSELYTYENHDGFIPLLKKIKDRRLFVRGECVSSIELLPDQHFDIVISSLPLANLSDRFKENMYKEIQAKLLHTGIFIQYQYFLHDYRNIEKSFHVCELDFCLFNLPPAFIYKAKMMEEKAVQLSEAWSQKV